MAGGEGVFMVSFCWRLVDLAGVALCCYNSFLLNDFTGINFDGLTKIHEYSL